MEKGKGPGPFAYGLVFVVLGCYFGWLLDRMANFSHHGFSRLTELCVGIGIGVLALIVAGAATKLAGRHK